MSPGRTSPILAVSSAQLSAGSRTEKPLEWAVRLAAENVLEEENIAGQEEPDIRKWSGLAAMCCVAIRSVKNQE